MSEKLRPGGFCRSYGKLFHLELALKFIAWLNDRPGGGHKFRPYGHLRDATGRGGVYPRPKRHFSDRLLFVAAIVLIYLSCPLAGSSPAQAASGTESKASLQLLRITPSGEDVPAGRQIVFQFNRPVVPLGRMERDAAEIPVAIEPALKCQWRWLNPSTLACQLDGQNALRPATRYKVSVQPGIKTEDGKTLAKAVIQTFVTERPKVSNTWFKTWLAPGSPQIGVRFNQPVRQESVAAHLFFKSGKGPRVAAELSDDPDFVKSSDYQQGLVWLVSPKEELPGGHTVGLEVEPGIASLVGSEPGADKRTVDEFHTFPKFTFIGLQCETKDGTQITIRANEKGPSQHRCNPAREISLVFSSPVMKEEVQKGIVIEPALTSEQADVDLWENVYSYSQLSSSREKNETYSIPLPNFTKPYYDYRIKAAAETIRDEFNRPLQGSIEIAFKTSHLPPDFFLFKPMAVLEKDLDTEAPLAVTNLDKIQANYDILFTDGKQTSQVKDIELPKALDVPTKIPLGVRGLLGRSSGLVEGQLTPTPPVPDKAPSDGWFFAQVTPFAVHAKLGHYNTTVWVTDLKTGQPVPGVKVQICKDTFADFGDNGEVLTEGDTSEDGIASIAGTKKIDPELKLLWVYEFNEPHLFVRCQKGEDLAVMPLTYDFRVDAEGANREYIPDWIRPLYGHIRAWGATAQGIYKAGDTVQYKIYVRDQNNRRFVLPPGTESPPSAAYALKVIDPMAKVVFERKDITLSEFGACDGEFHVPGNGAVGWYRFELSAPFSEQTWEPLRVLVSDFTPAPFKVAVDLNGKQFAVGDPVKVSTQATLHAGGPFANAAVRVTAMLDAQTFAPPDPKLRNFQFDVLEGAEQGTPPTQTLHQTEGTLSDKGLLETEFNLVESPVLYGRLTVEGAVRDDRGKFVANRATASYVGRDRYVGLFQQDWVLEQAKLARVRVAVVDRNGKPAAGTSIQVKIQREETKAARVKDAGDAYVTQYVQEWVDEESLQLTSEPAPVEFEFTPKHAGAYRIAAAIKDTLERVQATSIERWCVGGGQVLWKTTPGNMMNVYPEKSSYQVGETARFLAQNPYPGAKALITVERFGVLQSWVKTFRNSAEIIEVPVLPDYLPGFYLSVLVMSPRVEKAAAEDPEDLGKPTFCMGYVQVPVNDPYKEIQVLVKPQQEVYKPGDTVSVELEAHPRHPVQGEPAAPIELAVTVLDEAVFDLLMQGKGAFDPYQGFYSLDPLDLSNYNLIMQLVGREKLEKKGANPGGGGGPDLSMRSVFKFVSYWNPSLPVDAQGKARIEFKVPDNLTGWRVLAMAVSPEDLMGLGDAVFKVNQSTEIRPILPNQVTAGDSFDAGFTILNRTEQTRTLEVVLQADGPVQPEQVDKSETEQAEASSTQQLTLGPFERATVRMPIQTTGDGEIIFTVRAGDDKDKDGLKTTLAVQRKQSPVTVAAYGSATADKATQPVVFPEAMRTDSGKVNVTTAPTVIGGIEGSFQYLSKYPYGCWEQKLTVGVAASIYQRLKPYLDDSFGWPESEALPQKTLVLSAEYQAPNGGMTFYVPKDEYVSPYLSAFTALAFNWLRDSGHAPPQNLEDRLHQYLESLLKRDVTPDFYSKGMASTIRAVTLAALAGRAKIKQGDVERFADHVAEMSLFGKALYLQALLHFPETSKLQQRVLQDILAHADQTSGTLTFSESLDLRYKMLLSSPIRTNCAILSSLLRYQAAHPEESQLQDLVLNLVRTIALSRKARNHWPSTQENLFALKALEDFSRTHETVKPNMTVRVLLDAEILGEAQFTALATPPNVFDYSVQAGDAGRKAIVKIERTGQGRLYYTTALTYTPAELNQQAINSGIEVHREYSVDRNGQWVLLQSGMELDSSELVRVDLYLSLPAARYFVVVDDPVPGGLEPVNQDLATASTVDAAKGEPQYPEGSYWYQFDDWSTGESSIWSFYHKELHHSAARFYSEYLAPGRYHLSYVTQAIAPGTFTALPAHAEEMYEPDVFGKGVPAVLQIKKRTETKEHE